MIVSRTFVVGQGYTRPSCEDLHLDLYQRSFPPQTSTLWKALGSDCMVFATPLLEEVPAFLLTGSALAIVRLWVMSIAQDCCDIQTSPGCPTSFRWRIVILRAGDRQSRGLLRSLSNSHTLVRPVVFSSRMKSGSPSTYCCKVVLVDVRRR